LRHLTGFQYSKTVSKLHQGHGMIYRIIKPNIVNEYNLSEK
jgi:hypothetical protein